MRELLSYNDIMFQVFIFEREGNVQLMYARVVWTADKVRLLQPGCVGASRLEKFQQPDVLKSAFHLRPVYMLFFFIILN